MSPSLARILHPAEYFRRSRLDRERRTVSLMISLYCRAHHSPTDGICPECTTLQEYALLRIQKCPFGGADKPTCANCTVHCYKPEMRQRIHQVMRYSGPRMLYRHPMLTIRHLIDGWGRLTRVHEP